MRQSLAWLALAVFGLFVLTLVGLADAGRGQRLFLLAGHVPAGDKLCHIVLVGTLAMLANLATKGARLPWGEVTVLKGSLFVMVPVVLEEFSQLGFASRSFDLWDLAADGVGICLGGWMALYWLRRLDAGSAGLMPESLPKTVGSAILADAEPGFAARWWKRRSWHTPISGKPCHDTCGFHRAAGCRPLRQAPGNPQHLSNARIHSRVAAAPASGGCCGSQTRAPGAGAVPRCAAGVHLQSIPKIPQCAGGLPPASGKAGSICTSTSATAGWWVRRCSLTRCATSWARATDICGFTSTCISTK